VELSEYLISLLIKASIRKTKYFGSGNPAGTFRLLLDDDLVELNPNHPTPKSYNKLDQLDMYITEKGIDIASEYSKLRRL